MIRIVYRVDISVYADAPNTKFHNDGSFLLPFMGFITGPPPQAHSAPACQISPKLGNPQSFVGGSMMILISQNLTMMRFVVFELLQFKCFCGFGCAISISACFPGGGKL